MKQKKIDTVLFDLDGTLVNSLDDLTNNVNMTLSKFGYPERCADEIRMFVGSGVSVLIDRAVPNGTPPEAIKSCLETFKGYYMKGMQNKTKPYEGIIELLTKLKKINIKTAVVSNKLDEATKKMCDHYFPNLLGEALGEIPNRAKKPEPSIVMEALRLLDAKKENAIYVGDTKIDVATSKNAGIPILGATWGYRGRKELEEAGADFIIDHPLEVLRWLV